MTLLSDTERLEVKERAERILAVAPDPNFASLAACQQYADWTHKDGAQLARDVLALLAHVQTVAVQREEFYAEIDELRRALAATSPPEAAPEIAPPEAERELQALGELADAAANYRLHSTFSEYGDVGIQAHREFYAALTNARRVLSGSPPEDGRGA